MSMKTKLLGTALGALLLGTTALATAADWNDRGRQSYRGHDYRGWHDRAWRGDHGRQFQHGHRHGFHSHYRVQPRAHGWRPAPGWHRHHYRSGYHPHGYGRDGVTIILRGRVN
jgi:hypothetical protein